MKYNLLLSVFIIQLFSCGPKKEDIQQLAAEESFPDDSYLDKVVNKRALVVVAHDDDCAAMAGTLAKLNAVGWEIKQICFVGETAERDSALLRANKHIVDETEFFTLTPGERRPALDSSILPYMPIHKDQINTSFRYNEIASFIIDRINSFRPTVIFSLDNIIGGYGHPEHLLVSQLLIDSLTTGAIKTERIYQSVYPNSMERKILKERLTKLMEEWGYPSSYNRVTELYGVDGMPEPDVQIDITSASEQKMNFLRSFNERERKTIAFYIPHFEDLNHKEYFEIFNREFFRVLKADSLITNK